MVQIIQTLKNFFEKSKVSHAERLKKELQAEACRLINIKEVYIENGEPVYGLFLGENIIDFYPDLAPEMLTRMMALRSMYVKMWDGTYQVK